MRHLKPGGVSEWGRSGRRSGGAERRRRNSETGEDMAVCELMVV